MLALNRPLSTPSNGVWRLPASLRAYAYSTLIEPSGNPSVPPPWRPSTALDEWVERDARPISLRQLTFFGRTLTDSRLLSSANYVRQELPTRLAHRLRNMQTLPYTALTNHHIGYVYELYYSAFERLRKVPDIRTLDDNDRFCEVIKLCLTEHLTVIPRLAMGVLEIQGSISQDECDKFMKTLLRSRISRRVIAEQHLALTETFHSPWHFPNAKHSQIVAAEDDFVGEIFLKCNATEIITKCADLARDIAFKAYGPSVPVPEVVLNGHLDTTFPYIPSHLEYILGELLRNSIQAVMDKHTAGDPRPPPIEVLICGAAQHVIIRISDRGGGIDREILPFLWSFAKGPRRDQRLRNLSSVPRLAGTMQELQFPSANANSTETDRYNGTLRTLSGRPPDLRLGMGLPMSKIYAEYWAGNLELHSLEGYGTDAFLQISRLGNKNEQLSTRAAMDAL
ncbi:alpha-ketoacid dehydrogenase kinase [Polychaeton citri CBS 116435]|uniref:Protein-serine/threonine kinase n=1 Tax=Polychaeton citri CBS 116435 TaxID=1314669 RepID=A0A9P4Q6G2_9PEZI|nr:alpha-ketoacid dehydrogenase kinase [Polychaeton citri CBS 116435]